MNHYDEDTMTEIDSDAILEASVSAEILPNDIVMEVTPWRKSMNRILAGLAMTMITLEVWNLGHILLTAGLILSLMGWQTLYRENGWFQGCWIITLARTVYSMAALVLNATIFQGRVYASPVCSILTAVNIAFMFTMFFCIGQGFRAVQKKAGLPVHAGGAAALFVWYALTCLLALVQYSGWIILSIMLLLYMLIIRSLFRLSQELDEAGYVIQAAPVRVPDRVIASVIIGSLVIGLACAYLFCGSYAMEWQPFAVPEDKELVQIKDRLVGLGFPKDILEDLAEGDLRACKDASRVVFEATDYPANEGRNVQNQYDVKELRMTSIGVRLPGEQVRWKMFHHFLWTTSPGFHGTELLQLWPAYRDSEGWRAEGETTGQILYDDGGQVYAAPYYSLGSETYASQDIFFGARDYTDIFAEFSMPGKGSRHRGYLSYMTAEMQDVQYMTSWMNYIHQKSWMQYPVMTAKENLKANGLGHGNAFLFVQDSLHFYVDLVSY